jgi:hypothetical protein
MPFAEAMQVSGPRSAQNLLPMPGAVLVRTRALPRRGASVGGSPMATGNVEVGWLGLAALLAGLLLLASGNAVAGGSFAGVDLAPTGGMLFLARRSGGAWWQHGARIIASEAALGAGAWLYFCRARGGS